MKASPNQYASLAGFSSAITPCCFPILLLIRDLDPAKVLPVLCIINASHLLILCWVHLDYLYAILVVFGVCIGTAFIYSVPPSHTHFISLAWGLVSLVLGITIHIATDVPLRGYDYIIINDSF